MKQFVPMTDELLYSPSTMLPGNGPVRLVPYQCGVPCWHRLGAESGTGRDANAVAPAAPALAGKSELSV